MARWTIKNVRFAGVAACVPKEVIKTADFSFFTKEEAAVFDNTMGIRERHLGPDTLCASDMCQAMVETNLIKDSAVSEEQHLADMQRYPLKRYGRPEDIAHGIIYLLSDASSWVTGQSLIIDGGISL